MAPSDTTHLGTRGGWRYTSMVRRELEPGLLPVFRVFAAMQLLSVLGSLLLVALHHHAPHPLGPLTVMTVLSATLMTILSWHAARRAFGVALLPIALILASAVPAIGLAMVLAMGRAFYLKLALELSLMVLAPLLLIAWQYGLAPTIVFALATGAFDMVLLGLAGTPAAEAETLFHFFTARTIAFIATGYIIARLVRAQREQRATLRQAHAELARFASTLECLAVSQERNRMARELHDTLAHTLSSIAISLEAVRATWEDAPADASRALQQSLASARTGLTETRRALLALRALPVEELGLTGALRTLANNAAERAGVVLALDMEDLPAKLPPEVEQGIYRVAQEALENVVRHAGAHQVALRLRCDARKLTLEICDDGCGLADAGARHEESMGLRGLRERAAALGGTFELSSAPGHGTTVRLTLPQFEPAPVGTVEKAMK